MAKPWTAEELAIMKQRYPKEGASDALVKTLNRTKQAIHFKAQQVGLRNVKRKRFTDEDIEILRAVSERGCQQRHPETARQKCHDHQKQGTPARYSRHEALLDRRRVADSG